MAPPTFEALVKKERSRLDTERKNVANKITGLQKQLSEIDRQLKAVNAYDQAKKGTPKKRSTAPRKRTSRRADILKTLKNHPEGLARADILTLLTLKGDKSAEKSVSNALNNMKKAKKIKFKDGKYLSA